MESLRRINFSQRFYSLSTYYKRLTTNYFMRVSLKNVIVPSIPLAVLMVGFCFVLWTLMFFAPIPSILPIYYTTIAEKIQSFFSQNLLFTNLVCIALTLLNAFLLAQINNRFTIIRTRTFLPIFIFLLLVCTWNETHIIVGSHVALTLFVLALFNFFSMSKDRNASEPAFLGSFFIGLASLLINPYIFLSPVCWLGFIIFQSFSLRTFLASLLGAIVPWILFVTINYFINNNVDILQLFNVSFNFDFSYLVLTLPKIIYISALTLIMIIGVVGMYSLSNGDAIHTRNKLNFLLLLLVSALILEFFNRNQMPLFLPLLSMIYAMLISHAFTLKQNNFYGIIFYIFFSLNIAFVISKYFHI